ncbi:WAS/WASL-interacting protein family member 3-like [Schistocerca serialis cubense]|uniref:WAS/WASL-interacting protein family member 3-like n=1 Tax=Schistocerca serialis cubense TaxID=2023355 RepID=UPI00214F1BE1|nr:WAS/WASL-interacting protein family member 3-like [Schistocerca serialis cubense]
MQERRRRRDSAWAAVLRVAGNQAGGRAGWRPTHAAHARTAHPSLPLGLYDLPQGTQRVLGGPRRSRYLVRGGFQPRLPTSLPPPGQQQQPSPLPRRQPVPLMPPAQLHSGAPLVVAPAPAVPLQSPPPSELMDVDPSAGPPSQAVAVQPVLQPLSLGSPKESDTAAPCPAPTQQPSTQRQETLPLFVGPDAPSRPLCRLLAALAQLGGVAPSRGQLGTDNRRLLRATTSEMASPQVSSVCNKNLRRVLAGRSATAKL